MIGPLESFALDRVVRAFRARGVPAERVGNHVRLGQGTPEIRAEVEVRPATPSSQALLARVTVRVALNPAVAETLLIEAGTGHGETAEEAVDQAVEAWGAAVVPVVLSLLGSASVGAAEWVGPGDPLGLPGYEVCLGPYVLRGGDDAQAVLGAFLDGRSLVAGVAPALAPALSARLMSGVSLYWGHSGRGAFSEVCIDGLPDDALTEALAALDWPTPPGYCSVRTFVIALRPHPAP